MSVGQFVDDEPTHAVGQFVDDEPAPQAQPAAASPAVGGFVDDAPKKKAAAPTVPDPKASVEPTHYADSFAKAAKRWNVDENWLRSIHAIEDSSDDPRAVSAAGAVGEMQMLPGTFKQYADPGTDATDPDANINAGAHYFSYLVHRFKGNVDAALASYNVGEGAYDKGSHAGDGYARQAEANYKFLSQALPAPGASLSKGDKPKPKPTSAPKPTVAKPSAVDSWLDEADKKAQEVYDAPGQIGRDFMDNKDHIVSPEEMKQIKGLLASGPAQGLGKAASFIGRLADVLPETLNAFMRDAVTPGQSNNLGEVGRGLWTALTNPTHAGAILDKLGTRYGINSKEELAYWTNPAVRDKLLAAKPTTVEGSNLQQVLSLHADWGRFLLTHRGIMNLDTMIEEFFNPGNHLPGGLLTHVAGPGAKLIGRTAMKGANRVAPGAAGAAVDWARANVPFMGDRFHRTRQALGDQEAAEHHLLASKIASAPHNVQQIFAQEHMFGASSLPERQQIAREQDKFFNPHETAHVLQPSGGNPIMDPVTKTIATKKGGLYGTTLADHYNHVFVAHTTEPYLLPKGKEATTLFGPNADRFSQLTRTGNYADALQLIPSITPAEAVAFEADVNRQTVGMTIKDRNAFARRQLYRRASGEIARAGGHEAVEYQVSAKGDQNEIWFTGPQKAIERDTSIVGNTPVYERAVNIANAVKMHFDDPINLLTPQVGKLFVSGFLARSGAFAHDQTIEEHFNQTPSAEAMQRGGGTGLAPGAPKRKYNSIRDAEAIKPDGSPGEEMNPKWDPAASNAKAMERSLRYRHYASYLARKSKLIDYDQVIQDAIQSGRIAPRTQVPQFGRGQLGQKEMMAFAQAEAQQIAQHMPGPNFQSLTDEQLAKRVNDARTGILKNIQEQFEESNPDHVFRLDEVSGIDDLAGSTMPKANVAAAIDSHPAFESGGPGIGDKKWLGNETPDNKFANAFESVIHLMRTAFMIDPTYHQRENLTPLLFTVGKLNPLEIRQILMAPNTIDPKLLARAEEYGATSVGGGAGFVGRNTRARSAYANPAEGKDPERNLLKRQMDLPTRLKTVLAGYQNVIDGSGGSGNAAVHILAHTAYTADKWNRDLTFGVWEDVSSAVLFGKLEKKLGSPELAARETRKILGDSLNMTALERKLGLQRLEWFYTWMKGQMRLWASKATNSRVVGANNAVQDTISTNNQQEDVKDPQTYTDRGQAIIEMGGQHYAMGAAPPPFKKLMAMNSIYGAPFTSGEGLMDFGQYMDSTLSYDASPAIKAIVDMTQTFGYKGEASSDTLAQFAGSQAQKAAGEFVPPPVRALAHGSQDAPRYLELLGVPVINIDAKSAAIGPSIELAKLTKLRDMMLRSATNENARTNIKNYYNASIQRLTQQAAQARGQ